MLTAHQLTCLRNYQVLFSKLDLSVAPTEILHITGPNGCGKSTLLHLLTGLLTPQYGKVYWQGTAINSPTLNYHSQVTYIGHKAGIKNSLTVLENLQMAADFGGGAPSQDWQAILHRFGLANLRNTLCYSLSAGQRQRVALSRLLLMPTPLWILDEPFTALDNAATTILQEILLEHCQRGGMVILTSHHALNWKYQAVTRLELGGVCD